MRLAIPVTLVAASLAAQQAAAAEGRQMAFVTCPIVQDTPSVPCWLVEYEGETYYMGIQTDVSADFNPPSLGHMVLVEGTLTDREICGGKVIEPIKVSVMPELSPECDELRHVVPGLELGFEPPRPPGPSAGRLAFQANFEPPPVPQPPYEPKNYTVHYSFDGMVSFSTPRVMTPALEYAQLSKAKKMRLEGYRGATQLDDGTLLEERPGIARARAEELAAMFRGAGLEDVEFEIVANDEAVPGGPDGRRVEITVLP
jgi:hypothetical protein